jgi:hypothetical protein
MLWAGVRRGWKVGGADVCMCVVFELNLLCMPPTHARLRCVSHVCTYT